MQLKLWLLPITISVWEIVIDREQEGLMANSAFLPSTEPQDYNVVGDKWLLKIETNQFDDVARANARIAAK